MSTQGDVVTGTVLVVAHDADARARFTSWLAETWLNVVSCPGPCAGPEKLRQGVLDGCPLMDTADVVVLDLDATLGAAIALRCAGPGKPAILVSEPDDPVHPFEEAGTIVLPRPVDRRLFLEAVWRLLAEDLLRAPAMEG